MTLKTGIQLNKSINNHFITVTYTVQACFPWTVGPSPQVVQGDHLWQCLFPSMVLSEQLWLPQMVRHLLQVVPLVFSILCTIFRVIHPPLYREPTNRI